MDLPDRSARVNHGDALRLAPCDGQICIMDPGKERLALLLEAVFIGIILCDANSLPIAAARSLYAG
jgi:hypothetical protein